MDVDSPQWGHTSVDRLELAAVINTDISMYDLCILPLTLTSEACCHSRTLTTKISIFTYCFFLFCHLGQRNEASLTLNMLITLYSW